MILKSFEKNRLIFSYQMTQLVIIIVASDNAVKKSNKAFPLSPILPSVIPKTIPKTTNPRVLVPSVYACEISQFSIAISKKAINQYH